MRPKHICFFTTESSKRRFQGLPFNINQAYLISFPITGNGVPPANDKLIYWKLKFLLEKSTKKKIESVIEPGLKEPTVMGGQVLKSNIRWL